MLGAMNTTRTTDSYPSYYFSCSKSEIFHRIQSNKGSRSSQSCLAVDSYSTIGTIATFEESFNNIIRGCRSIIKIKIDDSDAIFQKWGFIIDFAIKSEYEIDSQFLKEGDEIGSSKDLSYSVFRSFIERSSKCHKLFGYNYI